MLVPADSRRLQHVWSELHGAPGARERLARPGQDGYRDELLGLDQSLKRRLDALLDEEKPEAALRAEDDPERRGDIAAALDQRFLRRAFKPEMLLRLPAANGQPAPDQCD